MPFPDFHAAVATLAPVLVLTTLAIRRWARGGSSEHPSATVRRLASTVYLLTAVVGFSTFSVAMVTLAGLAPNAGAVARVIILVALYVQFCLAGMAVVFELVRPTPNRRPRRRRARPRLSRRVHHPAGTRRRLRRSRRPTGRILDARTHTGHMTRRITPGQDGKGR